MTQRFRIWIAVVLIPLCVLLDQWTKFLVLNEDRFNALGCLDRTQPCGRIDLSAFLDLTMLWNRGMSFGFLQSEGIMRWVLFGVQSVIALIFLRWLFTAERRLTVWALALVVGGAIGNMIDRARFGAVVDFIDVSALYFPWIFNIADSAVSVGAALLFLDFFLASRAQSRAGD